MSSNNNKKLNRTEMLIFSAIGLCVNLLPTMACIALQNRNERRVFSLDSIAFCMIDTNGHNAYMMPAWDGDSNRSSGRNGNEDEVNYSHSSVYVTFQSASILDIFALKNQHFQRPTRENRYMTNCRLVGALLGESKLMHVLQSCSVYEEC